MTLAAEFWVRVMVIEATVTSATAVRFGLRAVNASPLKPLSIVTRSGQIAATSLAGLSTCADPAAGVGARTTPVSPFASVKRPDGPPNRYTS